MRILYEPRATHIILPWRPMYKSRRSDSVTMFTWRKSEYFVPYSEKDNIPIQIFTWPVNILLIILFACSHSSSDCLVGLCSMHRADHKEVRGSVSQTARKTKIETHVLNAMCTCPKTQIIATYPTCLDHKMLNKARFGTSKWNIVYMPYMKFRIIAVC